MSARFAIPAYAIVLLACYVTYVEPIPAELELVLGPLALVALSWIMLWPRAETAERRRVPDAVWEEHLELNRYSFGIGAARS